MEYSDAENGSDGEIIDDILGPEDLFNDEADEGGDGHRDHDEAEEDPGVEAKEKAEKKVKKPRIVKNPRVTLNINALTGSNGLSALKKMFSNFKFKGNGHEQEDLTRIMEILHHWMCYKLCPSYSFESCMLQLEALGKKKVVQTLMKKYRLGMDDWGEHKSDTEDRIDDNVENSEQIQRSEFDILLDEEIANARSDDELSLHEVPQSQVQPSIQIEQEVTLTQEQLERIARNRKLAEERRMKRMSTQCEAMEVDKQQQQEEQQQQQQQENDQEISLEQINLEEKC